MSWSSELILSTARRRAGLTQRGLSRRSGVPQPTISRIERGKVSPTMDTLNRLLRACGMELVPVDAPKEGDVDRSQIRERLKWSPAERFAVAVDAANEMRRLLGSGRSA